MEKLEEYYFPGIFAKHIRIFTSLLDINTDPRHCDRRRGRFPNKRPRPEFESLQKQIVFYDDSSPPEFPPDIIKIEPMDIHKGNTLDINSLLISDYLIRNNVNGDLVDVKNILKGKYVMICCFHVPVVLSGSGYDTVFNLSLISKELSTRVDFEIVLVVKMRPNWEQNKDAFKHFVSGFSESCLVVPFEDITPIDYICRSMNLKEEVSALLVGPDGVVVQDCVYRIANGTHPLSENNTIGRSWRNQTLHQLLGDSCSVVYRNQAGIGPVSVSVSELEKKEVVGLYLCGLGCDIPLFDRVYNECRAKQLEFEIVLVYNPLTDHPPEVLQEVIGSFLDKRKISWWVLPFSYFVSKRLFKLVDGLFWDKLLILRRGELVEADGEVLLRCFGCDGYPFHSEMIIERGLEKVKQHTLESLFGEGSLFRGNNPTDEVSVSHLRSRNVIVFLDGTEKSGELYQLIEKHYYDIKKKHAGFEVVFVNTDATSSRKGEEDVLHMPWLVFRPSKSQSQCVVRALSVWDREPVCCLVAFGKDGRICSLNAQGLLRLYGSKAFPFSGDVRRQLAFWLKGHLDRFKN